MATEKRPMKAMNERQLGREDRPQPDRQGCQVDEVPSVGEEHLPFEERDDAEEDHDEEEDVVLVLPGRVEVGREFVLEEDEKVGAPPDDDRQDGQDGDEPGLHLVLEVDDVVPEEALKKMLRQDPDLGAFLPQAAEAAGRDGRVGHALLFIASTIRRAASPVSSWTTSWLKISVSEGRCMRVRRLATESLATIVP